MKLIKLLLFAIISSVLVAAYFNLDETGKVYEKYPADNESYEAAIKYYMSGDKDNFLKTLGDHFTPGNGNPILPGYFADPNIYYEDGTFYIYSTTDGIGCGEGPSQVWSSNDFVNWTNLLMNWPKTQWVWAPGMVKSHEKYYLYTSTGIHEIYCGVSDSPIGPWENAVGKGKPFMTNGQYGNIGALDAGLFTDDDGSIYMVFGNGTAGVGKLNPDMTTFAEGPVDITDQLPNYMEGSFLIKRNGIYYLMYSVNSTASPYYHIEYSTSTSPMGPYVHGKNNPILKINDDKTIRGPGHHSVFEYNDQYYIIYHKLELAARILKMYSPVEHDAEDVESLAGTEWEVASIEEVGTNHYIFKENGEFFIQGGMAGDGLTGNYIQNGTEVTLNNGEYSWNGSYDGKEFKVILGGSILAEEEKGFFGWAYRQTFADKLVFAEDGTIKKVKTTFEGIGALVESSSHEINLAFNKSVTTSSELIPYNVASFAVDENYGTRWAASDTTLFGKREIYSGSDNNWLTIDLGKLESVSRTEIYFEYPTKEYAYKIEYSNDGQSWNLYADQSEVAVNGSPIIDCKDVKARQIKLTILKGDPTVWELKIF